MATRFQPATRKRAKLRLGIDGPAGSGKTYTALRMAFALGKRVAVIDTEAGSASKYAHDAPDGVPFNFDVLELASFAPTEYTAAIEDAGASGYDVIIVDSLSHAWQGKEGALELVSKKGGNSFTAWKDVTPMHVRMIDAILRSPAHVIATMRSKVEYVLETNDKGKEVPRKIGMAPIQRAGMEYEFDLYGSLDWSHVLTISKSRCSAVDGAIAVKPGPAFLAPVIRWLETGESGLPAMPTRIMVDDATVERIVGKIATLGRTLEREKKELFKRYTVDEFAALTGDQAIDYEKRLDVAIAKQPKKADSAPVEQAAAEQAAPEPPPAPAPNCTALRVGPGLAATIHQLNKLLELKAEFFHMQSIHDPAQQEPAWSAVLAKRGVARDVQLSEAQAQELIDNLLARIEALCKERGIPHTALPF